jgi:hypothetical protein
LTTVVYDSTTTQELSIGWSVPKMYGFFLLKFEDKGNNKITELRTILQRESQNS